VCPRNLNPLAVIGTHPVQYLAPVYAAVERQCGIPVHAIYGSDFSIQGGYDRLFQKAISWDNFTIDLNTTTFLSRVADYRPRSTSEVKAAGLYGALEKVSPGAVLLTGYSPWFHMSAFFQARRFGAPILFRGDATDYAWKGKAAKRWMRDQALRRMYGRCDRLLPIGTHAYEHYKRLGCPDAKLIRAPFCVDMSAFSAGEESRPELRACKRRELGMDESGIVVLYSGKLAYHKAPHLVIEGVRRVPKPDRERMVVVFVGSGPDRDRLEALAAGPEPVRVHFAGFQNQTQLSPFYHCADLMVLASYRETWGLVINEALHHGLPCVVSDSVGCAVDLIEPGVTGEITVTGDAGSLAEGINRGLRLARDPEIRRKCRERVSMFSVERAAEGIAKAYWSVLSR
jgi:glycosyltransferase involved in cell wall biosynthesis